MNPTYRVVIKGVRDGFNKEQVIGQLASLFKVTEDIARSIIDASSYVVKKGIDLQATAKYQAALEQRGCVCVIEPEEESVSPPVLSVIVEPVPLQQTTEVNSVGIIKCHQCGFQLPDTAKFCRSCGAKQSIQSPSTPQSEVPTPSSAPDTPPPSIPPAPVVQNILLIEKKTSTAKYAIIGAALIATVAMAGGGYMIWKKHKPAVDTQQAASSSLPQNHQATPAVSNQDPNHTKTVAGDLVVVEKNIKIFADGYKPDFGDGGTLALGGRVVFDAGIQHINITHTFDFSRKTVVLFSQFDSGNGSGTSLCQFLTVQQDGKVAVTDGYLDCDESTNISVNQEEITVTQPYPKYGDDVWKFANGALTKIKEHDSNAEKKAREIAEKNAVQLVIVEDKPMRIRGTLKLDDLNGRPPGDYWVLKLPSKTNISGNDYCHIGLRDSVEVYLGYHENRPILPPNIKGEAEFDVTFSCSHAGVNISGISIAEEPPKREQVAQPSKHGNESAICKMLRRTFANAPEVTREFQLNKSGCDPGD